MTVTNKELMDKLSAYLETQDMKIVCRALANAFLDYHRIHNPDQMDADEAVRLFKRIKLNAEQLSDFAINGPTRKFGCGPLSDDET